MVRLNLPYSEDELLRVKAGDEVFIYGTLYVGRDQVHKRLYEAIAKGEKLPIELNGNGIYYMGPSPKVDGFALGAAGPTTSARMDPFSPTLLKHGLRVMVGKGPRSSEVLAEIKEYKGLYLQAFGGCGALYSSCIKKSEVVSYPELGPEALLRLEVEAMPCVCIADSNGNVLC